MHTAVIYYSSFSSAAGTLTASVYNVVHMCCDRNIIHYRNFTSDQTFYITGTLHPTTLLQWLSIQLGAENMGGKWLSVSSKFSCFFLIAINMLMKVMVTCCMLWLVHVILGASLLVFIWFRCQAWSRCERPWLSNPLYYLAFWWSWCYLLYYLFNTFSHSLSCSER